MKTIFGIDYGAQLAGTTAVCMNRNGSLHILQSEKKARADDFIINVLDQYDPTSVFIDAPLSLPPAYTDPSSSEFMFREADKVLKAMSPMFLGGLTARAMQMARKIRDTDRLCMETYPKALMKELFEDQQGYKKRMRYIDDWNDRLVPLLPLPLEDKPSNWHQFDAVLCWLSGYRYEQRVHQSFGSALEGQIII